MSKDDDSGICKQLHELFNSLERFNFPFDDSRIPKNGIYILFEKGECAYGMDRIVRIGTHTGDDQLRSRLKQHFIMENKDRSIFRKNIGRALLNKSHDPFLKQWEIDLTPKDSREKNIKSIDMERQKDIERQVTDYMQKSFSFAVIRIDDKKTRLYLESRLISTISLCKECTASKDWLGKNSPVKKIAESGLWNVQELYKTPMDEDDIKELKTLIGK